MTKIRPGGGVTVAQANAAFARRWQASTAYGAGETVLAPDGTLVKAKVAFTSGSSFSPANWTTLGALGSVSGAVSINPSNGPTQTLTLAGTTTISPQTAVAGTVITLVLTQDSTGSRTVTWSPQIAWQTTPVLSTAAGLTDVVTLVCVDGWAWLGFVSGVGMTIPVNAIVDSFNRANAASLGTTDTGQAWATSVNWTIASNQALPTAAGVTTRAVLDTGRAKDIKVSVKTTNAAQGIRLEARAALDDSTYYRLIWSSLTASNSFIQKNTGGGFVTVGTTFALGAVVGDRIGFSVTESGGTATIKAYRNNTEVYSTTDASPPPAANYAGMIGMTTHAVDDFQVDFL